MILAEIGHKPGNLGGAGNGVARRLVAIARSQLEELRPDTVITGMGQGWGQALAVAADQMGIEWWAYLPYPEQDRMWPSQSKELHRILLARAHAVHVVSTGGHEPAKIRRRNETMVEHATHVLALWDGGRTGETWDGIRYAQQVKKPVINMWSKWREQ